LTTDMSMRLCKEHPSGFWIPEKNNPPQLILMLCSHGYAMLFGNCCVSLIGARRDPDTGLMHEGKGCCQDLIELSSDMIDQVVFQVQRNARLSDFEQTLAVCILSDDSQKIDRFFHTSFRY